jgi:hypothetical protein
MLGRSRIREAGAAYEGRGGPRLPAADGAVAAKRAGLPLFGSPRPPAPGARWRWRGRFGGAGGARAAPAHWGFPRGHWVALVAGGEPPVLRSSEVYGVAKATGEVSDFGDAGEEG